MRPEFLVRLLFSPQMNANQRKLVEIGSPSSTMDILKDTIFVKGTFE